MKAVRLVVFQEIVVVHGDSELEREWQNVVIFLAKPGAIHSFSLF
jgi:hypothetical protein